MKNTTLFLLLATIIFSIFFFTSCKDSCEREITYIQHIPVYKTSEEMRAEFGLENPRTLENPGKIYMYNNYILINEIDEGIHIFNNEDPYNPSNIAFIRIGGNTDLAVRNNILYANNYIDLITIDISTIQSPILLNRVEAVFPSFGIHQTEGFLVRYDEKEVTEIVDCDQDFGGPIFGGWGWPDILVFESSGAGGAPNAGGVPTSGGSGVGGSLARFTIAHEHLYIVDNSDLKVFDLSNPEVPDFTTNINLGWGIETIFPYQNNLFIGSNSGMFIFDNSSPQFPVLLSEFEHARACDPVFVKDNRAYVTLRDGNECQTFTNQLDLVDITDLNNPSLIKSFPMFNPHGLSIKDNSLFICEGEQGLKTFDISDPNTLDQRLLEHLRGFNAYDVIANPGNDDHLFLIGKDGFYQFDFSDPSDIKEMSVISVVK